jgi:hypothetical protein
VGEVGAHGHEAPLERGREHTHVAQPPRARYERSQRRLVLLRDRRGGQDRLQPPLLAPRRPPRRREHLPPRVGIAPRGTWPRGVSHGACTARVCTARVCTACVHGACVRGVCTAALPGGHLPRLARQWAASLAQQRVRLVRREHPQPVQAHVVLAHVVEQPRRRRHQQPHPAAAQLRALRRVRSAVGQAADALVGPARQRRGQRARHVRDLQRELARVHEHQRVRRRRQHRLGDVAALGLLRPGLVELAAQHHARLARGRRPEQMAQDGQQEQQRLARARLRTAERVLSAKQPGQPTGLPQRSPSVVSGVCGCVRVCSRHLQFVRLVHADGLQRCHDVRAHKRPEAGLAEW